MNDTMRVISERYSCRAYDGRLPDRDKLEAIAMAAVQAPSAMNLQPWRIIVVTDKALLDDMDESAMKMLSEAEDKSAYERIKGRGGRMFYNAPCMFLIVKQKDAASTYVDVDCGILTENIALAASSMGLGNVICGMAAIPLSGPDGDRYRKRLGFPDGWGFGVAVLVGHAADGLATPHEPDKSKITFVSP